MSIDTITEAEAIADWKAGDLLAGGRLIRMHAGLIYSTVRRYVTDRCELDDLLQVGRWALLMAALTHDAALGRLSTWAAYTIRGQAALLARRAWRLPTTSLDAPTGEGMGTLLDCLPAPEVEQQPDIDLEPLVAALPEPHRDTIRRLYGPTPQTLEEVGAARGISKEAARMSKERALDRLRIAAGEEALGTHNAKRRAYGAARRERSGMSALRCSICGGERHNKRTCPKMAGTRGAHETA